VAGFGKEKEKYALAREVFEGDFLASSDSGEKRGLWHNFKH